MEFNNFTLYIVNTNLNDTIACGLSIYMYKTVIWNFFFQDPRFKFVILYLNSCKAKIGDFQEMKEQKEYFEKQHSETLTQLNNMEEAVSLQNGLTGNQSFSEIMFITWF
jgi:hypothetical protein